ncbi:MAG TPA: thermonuclease family protein [Acidimicrobiales bacterium]|nr:thermonuclease family protein [Acidimicrobiales bacterium]
MPIRSADRIRARPVRAAARQLSVGAAVALLLTAVACGDAGDGRTSGFPAPAPPLVELPHGLDTTVERVVAGDTIVVAGGHHIRLIGVDTPETKDPRRPVQCFGREASTFLADLLPRGTGVRLVGDVEATDFYDRTLAYAYRLPDGLFVNADLVRQGYARVLTIPPNVAHTDELVALAQEAREAGRGLWVAC